jgi:heat shock protein beta
LYRTHVLHFALHGVPHDVPPDVLPPFTADLYDNYYARKPSIKLYVRRVFISESFEDLLPK